MLKLRYLLVIFIIAAIIAAGWYMTRPTPVTVSLYTVAKGNVEATVSNTRVGTVKACRRSMLAPVAGGKVANLTVKEGDTVKAGQLLLEIWNDDLKAELQLANARKTAAQADARGACAKAEGAKRDLKRIQGLVKDKLVSEESVDTAATKSEAEQAACEAARASISVNDAQIAVANSELERTQIQAPFSGVVAEVNTELGEFVTPSPPGILTLPAIDLLDLSCFYVSAPIDEVDAPPITRGMHACVKLDAFPERRCQGVVRRVAPYVLDVEKQARTVEVEVELNDPKDIRGLLPGYSADIEILLESHDDVIRIPTEAVLEGYRVLLYDAETGYLREKKFEPGLSNWNFTEVKSGLRAGDRIVLSVGREGVSAGVKAVPEDSASQQEQP